MWWTCLCHYKINQWKLKPNIGTTTEANENDQNCTLQEYIHVHMYMYVTFVSEVRVCCTCTWIKCYMVLYQQKWDLVVMKPYNIFHVNHCVSWNVSFEWESQTIPFEIQPKEPRNKKVKDLWALKRTVYTTLCTMATLDIITCTWLWEVFHYMNMQTKGTMPIESIKLQEFSKTISNCRRTNYNRITQLSYQWPYELELLYQSPFVWGILSYRNTMSLTVTLQHE